MLDYCNIDAVEVIDNSNHDLGIMDIETMDKYCGTTLAKSVGLTEEGNIAWGLIVDLFSKEMEEYLPPSQVFYSPSEWVARGESFGHNSVLIIMHEEGMHDKYFNWNVLDYHAIDRLQAVLGKDMYCEQCTSWYSAVYLLDNKD